MVKKLIVVIILGVIAVVVFQLGQYGLHYGKARDVLDSMILKYDEYDEDEFRHKVVEEYRDIGLHLDSTDIEIEEEPERRTVHVKVYYTTELNILFVSIEKKLTLKRTSRDVDF